MTLRKGNVGFNDAEKEMAYGERAESAWPIPGTRYTSYYLNADQSLAMTKLRSEPTKLSYKVLGRIHQPELISFTTPPFEEETEITGYIAAHLNVSITAETQQTSQTSTCSSPSGTWTQRGSRSSTPALPATWSPSARVG